MRWLPFFWTVGACGLAAGCQLLVTFETLPDGGGGEGGGGGACAAACCAAADCPDTGDPCVLSVCQEGVCGAQPVADGADAGAQTPGDCKKNICQGGVAQPVADDDPLDDGNACTIDTCEGGSPSASPAPAGSPCSAGGGVVCDGEGKCVECLAATDCPAAEPVCDVAAKQCVSAACANGQKDPAESDVDCGGQCSPCGQGKVCMTDADCASGICNSGQCAAPACDDGRLNGGETDVDCGGSCPQPCGPGEGCDADADCAGGDCTGQGGTCVPNCLDSVTNGEESDVDCGGGSCSKCGDGQLCAGSDANCQSGNCGAGNVCTSGGGGGLGSPCASGASCASSLCVDGVCCSSACGGACQACNVAGSLGSCAAVPAGTDPSDDCDGDAVCGQGGACVKPLGASCGANDECSTDICWDGVCCGSPCGDICQSCAIQGAEGLCMQHRVGTDPDNECPGAMACDGGNGCTY